MWGEHEGLGSRGGKRWVERQVLMMTHVVMQYPSCPKLLPLIIIIITTTTTTHYLYSHL